MSKKFKFKLEGLLKIRKFKEKKIKAELGEIVKKQTDLKEGIQKLHGDITHAYQAQKEALTGKEVDGRLLQFFPIFIEQKKAHIENLTQELVQVNHSYNEKVSELGKAMGDVKVIESMEDKQRKDHNKKIEKKRQDEIDDILSMRRRSNSLGDMV